MTLPELKQSPAIGKTLAYRQSPNWSNLMEWLQRFHRHEACGINDPATQLANGARADVVVVGGMFSMAEELTDVPWERIEKILLAQRPMLRAVDQRWG